MVSLGSDYLTQFALIDNRSLLQERLALTGIVFLLEMRPKRLPIDKGLFYDTNIAYRDSHADCPNTSAE